MTEHYVPVASMMGIVFSLTVAWGVPIMLCFHFYKKRKADFYPFLIGCASFFLFAMILEQMMHVLVLQNLGGISQLIQGNLFLYALYGGLAAGVFEETGRYLSMKFLMKKGLRRENALMYGAGHGGIEAELVLGTVSFNNLTSAILINSGDMLSAMGSESDAAALIETLSPLWTVPSWQFFLGGIERLMAITLHLALSVLVYQSLKNKEKWYCYPAAIGCHALVNMAAILVANHGSLILAEVATLIGTIAVCYFTGKIDEKNIQK